MPPRVLFKAGMHSKYSERSHTRESETVSDGEMLLPLLLQNTLNSMYKSIRSILV